MLKELKEIMETFSETLPVIARETPRRISGRNSDIIILAILERIAKIKFLAEFSEENFKYLKFFSDIPSKVPPRFP